MIEAIVPASVLVSEAYDDHSFVHLFAEEAAAVAKAVPRRRQEFGTARACARYALARLGHPPSPVVPGQGGAPRWPDGVVGSLTHCDGYRAAAVASSDVVSAIGIDAEPNGPLPNDVLGLIARPSDLANLPTSAGVCWDRLLFSAKEAVYKAWYPAVGTLLGFDDVEVAVSRDGTFTAQVLPPAATDAMGAPTAMSGRWMCAEGLLVTAIVLRQLEPKSSL